MLAASAPVEKSRRFIIGFLPACKEASYKAQPDAVNPQKASTKGNIIWLIWMSKDSVCSNLVNSMDRNLYAGSLSMA
jgi:hypothetical protein